MKIFVFALCVSLALADTPPESYKAEVKERLRSSLGDASEQFIDDMTEIYTGIAEDNWAKDRTSEVMFVLWHGVKRNENSKFTVQGVKDYLSKLKEEFSKDSAKQQVASDALQKLETIYSAHLQAERYSKFMIMARVFNNADSTTEEIENVLHYYYGTN